MELLATWKQAAEHPAAGADAKNRYARGLLMQEAAGSQDRRLAMKLARAANEMTNFENPVYLHFAGNDEGEGVATLTTEPEAIGAGDD